MKKIINGKKYDTETAEELAYWENMPNALDFNQYSETLYRKKTGEYFLHGEGGPMTKYARTIDSNSWSGGERIMPLTVAKAQAWAEEHLDGDKYEKIFGVVTDDDSRQQVCFSISVATLETIKLRAAAAGITESTYIDQLVQSQENPSE